MNGICLKIEFYEKEFRTIIYNNDVSYHIYLRVLQENIKLLNSIIENLISKKY